MKGNQCAGSVLSPVPMVDIREMGMGVRRLSVLVFVDMAQVLDVPRMAVRMVAVVMLVPMFVLFRAMDMAMRMPADEEDGQRNDDQDRGHRLDRADLLPQNQDRQSHPEEGGRREEHLASRRPELLRRGDVEDDADPVAEHADEQGRARRRQEAT